MNGLKFLALAAVAAICFAVSTPKTQAQVSVEIGVAQLLQHTLRIVGSAPSFWITDGVLTALPAVIVGLWEARPRRAGPSMPEVAGVG